MKTLTKAQWRFIQMERRAAQIKEFNPDKNIFNDIMPFLRQMAIYERQLQRLAEHSCNGYPKQVTEFRDGKMYSYAVEDIEWRERCEKRETKIERLVMLLACQYHLAADFQGDPRGMMFLLRTADGKEISV